DLVLSRAESRSSFVSNAATWVVAPSLSESVAMVLSSVGRTGLVRTATNRSDLCNGPRIPSRSSLKQHNMKQIFAKLYTLSRSNVRLLGTRGKAPRAAEAGR